MHLSVARWAHETPIHADWTKTDPERVRPITLSGRQWNEVPIADQAKQDPFHSMPCAVATSSDGKYRTAMGVMSLHLHRWSC